MQQAPRLQYRFLPARASVKSSAFQALRKASEHAAADLPAHRRNSGPEEQANAVALILHPRDARQVRLRALALRGEERMAALRSQLEACLLEDVQDLVIASRFESDGWVAGLANRRWIEQILEAANEQGQRVFGIWSAQAYASALEQGGEGRRVHAYSPLVESREPGAQQALGEGASEAGNPAGRQTGADMETRSDQWVWPPRERLVCALDPSMNLLEAMLLHRGEDPWAGMRGDRWWLPRGLRLALARARWSLSTMPARAWRQPLAALLGVALLAGLALQADTLRMRAEIEARETEVVALQGDGAGRASDGRSGDPGAAGALTVASQSFGIDRCTTGSAGRVGDGAHRALQSGRLWRCGSRARNRMEGARGLQRRHSHRALEAWSARSLHASACNAGACGAGRLDRTVGREQRIDDAVARARSGEYPAMKRRMRRAPCRRFGRRGDCL